MSSEQNFALRIPAELKQAAKALSKVGAVGPYLEKGEQGAGRASVHSINKAILYLMRAGIRQVVDFLEEDIAYAIKDHEAWQNIIQFFLNNPTTLNILPNNFPERSKEREFVLRMMRWKASEGLDRGVAADEFAYSQGRLLKLTEAKGALQRALCPAAGDNKS